MLSAGLLAMVERGEGVGFDLLLSAHAARVQAAVTVTSNFPALYVLEQSRVILPRRTCAD